MRLRRLIGGIIVIGFLAAPAFAQVTDDDLSVAEQDVASTRAQLEALAVES